MLFRTVDKDGDMMPIQMADQMLDGPEAVAAAVDSRIAMLYGEWWEDETLGFRVPEFLIDTIRNFETPMLERYISKYISDTEGVTGVAGVVTEMNNHEFSYECQIMTEDGTAELEVENDGILRAVY